MLSLSWLLSLWVAERMSQRLAQVLRSRDRYIGCTLVASLSNTAVLQGSTAWHVFSELPAVMLTLLAAAGIMCVVLAVHSLAVPDPPGAGAAPLLLVASALIGVIGLLDFLAVDLVGDDWDDAWKRLAGIQLGAVALLGVAEATHRIRSRGVGSHSSQGTDAQPSVRAS
jgi:hypothetical protein